MVIPSGQRSSDPAPRSSISGSAPNSAAMVVIMIGRKRSRQASRIASSGATPRVRSASMAKSTIMIAFFFTMPISSTMPTSATSDRSVPVQHQRQQRADAGGRQRRQDGDRVDPAFVQHAQHDVDHHHRGQDQPRFARRATLEFAASPE